MIIKRVLPNGAICGGCEVDHHSQGAEALVGATVTYRNFS